jgi:hypothetical protein
MSTEENNNTDRIRQEKLDAKQKEIVENLDNVSLKDVKEAKKETNLIGDSDSE